MRNFEIKNIKSHPSLSLAKANASRDLQINFNQAEDALTIPAESRHDYKCGFATQSGRSMIEMLGVLAIIGVLSVGGIAGYSKAMHRYRLNKAIEQITYIAGNVRSFFAPQKSYEGLNCGCYGQCSDACNILKKAKILPDEMITIDSDNKINITNALGYNRFVLSYFSASERAFMLQYFIGNNPEACVELMSYDWAAAGIKAIYTNGKYYKVPVDINLAVEHCYANIASYPPQAYAEGYPYLEFYFDINLNSTSWTNRSWEN